MCISVFIFLLDVDECLTNRHKCDVSQRAMCTNTEGGFMCQCRPGYSGNGFESQCGMYFCIVQCCDMTSYLSQL